MIRQTLFSLYQSIVTRAFLTFSKVSKKVTGPYSKGIFLETKRGKFIVDIDDMYVGRILRSKGEYAEDELKHLKKIVSMSSTAIIVGTHIGAVAIPLAKHVKRAIFIEANPRTFQLLKLNVEINDLNNTELHNVALGEKDGKIEFVLNTINSGGSKRLPINPKRIYFQDKPSVVPISLVSLDSLLPDKKISYDLIFMDIEGSEYYALCGMPRILTQTKALVIEFVPHHLENIANIPVSNLLSMIEDHFDYCFIPGTSIYLKKNEFQDYFQKLYEKKMSENIVIFTRESILFN